MPSSTTAREKLTTLRISDGQEASTAFLDHLQVNTHGTILIAEDTLLGPVPRTEKLEDTAFFVPLSCSSSDACCAGQITAVPQAPSSSGKTQEVHTHVMLSSVSL